jgi:hypothetical protein
MAKVDYSLPTGEYYCLMVYVPKDSDFTLDEAIARLQAALPGRVVRAFPARRDRRVLDYWGGKLIAGFYIGAKPSDARCSPPATAGDGDAPMTAGGRDAVLRAREILTGFRGVRVHILGEGEVCCRLSNG